MNLRRLASMVAVGLGLAVVQPACSNGNESGKEPSGGLLLVGAAVATPADLPKCNSTSNGTTAFVTTPPSMWSCVAKTWVQVPCVNALAGAVAYSSSTETLYACSAGKWTSVANSSAAPLLSVTAEKSGANCAAGGQRIDVGNDTNGNGSLDPKEVQQTSYVCNGEQGAQGVQGPQGKPGAQGEPGEPGAPALVSSKPIGSSESCAAGGVLLRFGADENGNEVLDPEEVTTSFSVCNGAPGQNGVPGDDGLQTLVIPTPETAGPNCAAGGIKLSFGTDANADGVLAKNEVSATSYVCNGADAPPAGGEGGSGGAGDADPPLAFSVTPTSFALLESQSVLLTVSFPKPPPADTMLVLSVDNPEVCLVPSSINVAAGSQSIGFHISTLSLPQPGIETCSIAISQGGGPLHFVYGTVSRIGG